MQMEDVGRPRQERVKPRRNPDKIVGILLGLAMTLTSVVILPIIFVATIGLGHPVLYLLLAALPGLFFGDRWTMHAIGLGMLISGWVNRARLLFAVVGPVTVCGAGAPRRLIWDGRKTKFSSAYAADHEEVLTGPGILRINLYAYLFATLAITGGVLVLLVLSALGLPDWVTRITVTVLAVMLVKVLGMCWYAGASISRNPVALERMVAAHLLGSASAMGVRPRDCDMSQIEALLSAHDGSVHELIGWSLIAERALDLDDFEEAEQAITRATLIANPLFGVTASAVYREAAFLAAYRDNDAETARIWLKQAAAPAFEEQTDARVEAAILMAEGKFEMAREAVRRGIAALNHSIDPGGAALDEKLLRDIMNRLDALPAPDPEVP